MKFIQKRILIDAIQYNGKFENIVDFIPIEKCYEDNRTLFIKTRDGDRSCLCGEWIIKDSNGQYFVCRDDIFHMSYEPYFDQEVHRKFIYQAGLN